ncbi:alpha/beta fold hydrolase, partial [Rhizobium lemnae]
VVLSGTGREGRDDYDPLLPLRTSGTDRPLFCVHPAGGSASVFMTLAQLLPDEIPVYGLQAKSLSPGQVGHSSVKEMAECYVGSMRKIQPEGPYRLLGWSFGGLIVQEMAAQLEAAGSVVETAILLDAGLSGDEFENAEDLDETQFLRRQAEAFDLNLDGVADENHKQAILEQAMRTGLLPPTSTLSDLEPVLRAMQAAPRLMSDWPGCKQLSGPIIYVRASDNKRMDLPERLTQVTSGTFEIVDVCAAHKDMCNAQESNKIAAIAAAILCPDHTQS